jgi:transposase InsO family protein
LKRFQLTENGYRKKFRSSKRDTDETVTQYVERLKRYLRQWLAMAGFKNDYKGLETLVLRDQFLVTCDDEMRCFLKEKGKLDLEALLEQAQNYVEAREISERNWTPAHRKRDTEPEGRSREFTRSRPSSENRSSSLGRNRNKEQDSYKDKSRFSNEWDFRNRKRSEIGGENRRGGCFHCGSSFHYAAKCDKIGQGARSHTVATMQCVEDREEIDVGHEVTISYCVTEGEEAMSAYTSMVLVNDQKVKALHDSGATCVAIRKGLEKPYQYTGRKVVCIFANGTRETYPTALIDIKSDEFEGKAEALVIDNLVKEIIISPGLYESNVTRGGARKEFTIDNVKKNVHKRVTFKEDYLQIGESDIHEGKKDGGQNTTLRTCVIEQSKAERPEERVLAGYNTRAHDKDSKELKERQLKGPILPDLKMKPEEIIALQMKDETLNKYWELANNKERNKDGKHRGNPLFVIKKGMLYREYKEVMRDEVRLQLMIPKELREKVMMVAHESLLSAHQGIRRTQEKVFTEFYWPSISGDIKRFVMSCDVCQRAINKQGVSKAPLGHLPLIEEPFRMICVDLVGPIEPRSSRGNRYILTIVDMATRFPEAIPLRGISTEEVADKLFEFYCRMGFPQRIHTDRGSQFTSELMMEVNRLLLIRHTFTSPYHAMGNGVVERMNGTNKTTLKKLIVEQPKEWDRYLTPLLFALRDSVQEGHGFSPFELVYGRSTRGPMKILKELWTREEVEDETRDAYSYMLELQERIAETCKIAQQQIEKTQIKNEMYYNKKARYRRLEIGERVLILLPLKTNKLMLKWLGPYTVKDKIGEYDYRVEVDNGKIKTYHINMMKRYNERVGAQVEDKEKEEMLATVVTVVNDGVTDKEEEMLELYSGKQKGTYKDVQVNPNLTLEAKGELMRLLEEYRDIFSDVPGRTELAEHEIKLTCNTPVRSKAYPTPYGLQKEIDREIEEMLESGVIERSNAAYAAPLVVVKKSDGSNRLCCNYKQLNKLTLFDPEPMMANDDVFNKLSGSQVFSKFDFCKGYWQIPMSESSNDMTTFVCANGLFRFNVMPFGLVNSASSYNRMMRKLLDGLKHLESYVDDVLAHTRSWEEHLAALREFFERVRMARLTLKPKKCQIGFETIDFLGHTLSGDKIKPKEESVDKIREMPRPRNKKQVRSFLGAVNYYRKFIPNCAELMRPLTELTRKNAKITVDWGEKLEMSFQGLKNALSEAPILKLPDIGMEFTLRTDASNVAMGCVLMQNYEGTMHPVAYASKKFSESERNYSVEERECLAMVWGIRKFNRYLYGQEFVVETDHLGLQYLKTGNVRNARVMRWYLVLQNYCFRVRYLKGSDNVVADYLSRGLE